MSSSTSSKRFGKRTKENRAYWTLLIFLSLIFSLLISEFGLRLIYREEEANGNYWGIGAFAAHDLTGYVHAPGYEGCAFRRDALESFVKINSLSLRQEDLEQQLQYPWLQIRLLDFLRTHSYMWMVIEKNLNVQKKLRSLKKRDRQTKSKVLSKPSLPKIIRPTLNAIVKLRDYCETNSIVFSIVMIPPKSGRTDFDKHLKVFFQEEEITVLDLGSKGYGNQDYLSRDGHWNRKGHEKASKFLVPFVVRLLE